MPHAGICAGGGWQQPSLPRPLSSKLAHLAHCFGDREPLLDVVQEKVGASSPATIRESSSYPPPASTSIGLR